MKGDEEEEGDSLLAHWLDCRASALVRSSDVQPEFVWRQVSASLWNCEDVQMHWRSVLNATNSQQIAAPSS